MTDIEAAFAAELAKPEAQATDPLACLDGINEAAPKTGKRKAYPVFPDPDGIASNLAKRIIDLADAKDQLETNNKLLGEHVTPFYFRYASGKVDVESSVKVVTNDGQAVLVTFKAQTKKMKDASAADSVRHIINGKERDLFRHTFDLKIDGDEIPAASVAAVVTELKALFAKHGCGKALKVEKKYEAFPSFYTQRHVLFTAEQNMEINRAVPVVVSVKSKDVQ